MSSRAFTISILLLSITSIAWPLETAAQLDRPALEARIQDLETLLVEISQRQPTSQ